MAVVKEDFMNYEKKGRTTMRSHLDLDMTRIHNRMLILK